MFEKLHSLYSTKRLQRVLDKNDLTRTQYMCRIHELRNKTDEELNVIMQDAIERFPEIIAYKYLVCADAILRDRYKGKYDSFAQRYEEYRNDIETDLLIGFGKDCTENVLTTYIRLSIPTYNNDCEKLAEKLEHIYLEEEKRMQDSADRHRADWGKVHLTMNPDGLAKPDISIFE